VGWIIFVPLSYLIPKKNNLICFVGRDSGYFLDNVKYQFLYLANLNKSDHEFYFLTQNRNTYDILKKNRLNVLYYPGIKSFIKILKTKIVVVDNWTWIFGTKYHLFFNSAKIQLWHGIPLKKIELNNPVETEKAKSVFNKLKNILGGRFPVYELLISTSEYFTDKSFKPAISCKNIIETGYPRNDIFFNELDKLNTIESNIEIINRSTTLKNEGNKIIVYCPTFRDMNEDVLTEKILDLKKLSDFALGNKLIFILKFHPNPDFNYQKNEYPNIVFYDNNLDIYPLLPLTDLLITDYSSIFFDYLLLNKPIIFFPYDFERYITSDRELDFDYDSLTPGPKCYNQTELEKEILVLLINGKDSHGKKRQEIADLAFKHKDGLSSERIYKHICENF